MLSNFKANFEVNKEAIENYLNPAQKSCELMRCMINNLVDLGKIETG
jgi:hypothetical protein